MRSVQPSSAGSQNSDHAVKLGQGVLVTYNSVIRFRYCISYFSPIMYSETHLFALFSCKMRSEKLAVRLSNERAVYREAVLLRLNSINYTRKKSCWIIKARRHEKNINTPTWRFSGPFSAWSPDLACIPHYSKSIPWSLISFSCSLFQFIVLITAETI